MSEWWGNLSGVITLVLMAVFIGIWIWAWRARHKKTFDRMARLPMEDMEAPGEPTAPGKRAQAADDNEDREDERK